MFPSELFDSDQEEETPEDEHVEGKRGEAVLESPQDKAPICPPSSSPGTTDEAVDPGPALSLPVEIAS